MASASPASPLLSIPLELRIKIYEHLLRPDSDRVCTLYHDRQGREASFDIDPTILRVNKQIYSEAVSIIYDTATVRIDLATPVVRQCTGGRYPDHITDPPDLFRKYTEGAEKPPNRLDWRTAPHVVKHLDFDGRLDLTAQGYIYPHCFQRLRNIQLVTSRHAIWGGRRGGSYFSHTGKTIVRILRLLAEDQATKSPRTKRLKFTMYPDWRTVESQLLMTSGEKDRKTKAIVGLLKALKRMTDVEVEIEEGVYTKTLRESKMEEAEVDQWEKVLSTDSDIDL